MIRHLLVAAFGIGCAFPAQGAYWSLFNVEGEGALTAQYVTYGSLADMLGDSNRLGVFNPTAGGAGRNIVGSGSNGEVYWSLFNLEGETALTAQYVTYGSLADMLGDTNRLGVFNPTAGGAGANIVGSGSDFRGSDALIPAPATVALLGIGLAVVGLARGRKQPHRPAPGMPGSPSGPCRQENSTSTGAPNA